MMEKGFTVKLEGKLRQKKSLILPSSKSKAIAARLGKFHKAQKHVIVPTLAPISESSLNFTRQLLKEAYYYKSADSGQELNKSESAKSYSTAGSSETQKSREK